MKIVLLESLAVPDDVLLHFAKPLVDAGHEFVSYPKSTDPDAQAQRAGDADVVMIANTPLGGEVIRRCDHLKFVDVAFTGVDHVDIKACAEKNVAVSNASGYSNEAVSELVLAMMLDLLRNVPQVEKRCREGGTKDGLVGRELKGKKVGVIGTGAIGSRVAELCHAFGCEILGNDAHPENVRLPYIKFLPLDDLLRESDIVTLHCPLMDSTRHLIDREKISLMKPSAILINAARGPIVDSRALADALNDEKISGAGVDVFEAEPPIDADHPLLHAKNTIVTPHVAFATEESMVLRTEIAFRNITEWMAGHQINRIL
jgi:Lactate dehydrogenase and related dehydrogenases